MRSMSSRVPRRNTVAQPDVDMSQTRGQYMSDVDTLKTGGGQAVSFASARLESRSLLPEQLIGLLVEMTDKNVDVDLQVDDCGTGPRTN